MPFARGHRTQTVAGDFYDVVRHGGIGVDRRNPRLTSIRRPLRRASPSSLRFAILFVPPTAAGSPSHFADGKGIVRRAINGY